MTTVLACTNRRGSVSAQLATWYAGLLMEKGLESLPMDLTGLPKDFAFSALYGEKSPDFDRVVLPLVQSVRVVLIVPEYNGSFPGVLKTMIDGLPRATLKDTAVALVGLGSGRMGSAQALSHLDDILAYLGAFTLPLRVRIPQVEEKFVEGKVVELGTQKALEAQADQLIKFQIS